jgi:hypothetical protein
MSGDYAVRTRTFQDADKGKKVMEEALKDAPSQALLVTITGDQIHVVGAGVRSTELWKLVAIAAQANEAMEKRQREIRLRPGTEPNEPRPDRSGRKRVPLITTDADGELHTPKGEQFIFCGECGHNTWYVTGRDDGSPGRNACTRCGNEIEYLKMQHETGRA